MLLVFCYCKKIQKIQMKHQDAASARSKNGRGREKKIYILTYRPVHCFCFVIGFRFYVLNSSLETVMLPFEARRMWLEILLSINVLQIFELNKSYQNLKYFQMQNLSLSIWPISQFSFCSYIERIPTERKTYSD